MHIKLTSKMEKYLQSKVKSGMYGNASEVVRDAIRRMNDEDRKLEALNRALQEGEEQIARGEGIVYTPERLKFITKRASANAKKGKRPNPDVLPQTSSDSFAES